MDISVLFLLIFDFYRFQIPKTRLVFNKMIERRKAAISAKKAIPVENFNQQYRSIALPYWKQFNVRPQKKAFKVFWSEGREPDPRYIPNDIWLVNILPHYNNVFEYMNLADKSIQGLLIQGLRYPDTLVKRVYGIYYNDQFEPISEQEALASIRNEGNVIIKQSVDSSGGLGVRFIDAGPMSDEELKAVLAESREDFVVQRLVKQHKVLSDINSTSINTIRMITFFYKDQVHLLSAALRIGGEGSRTDNITCGGFACGIHPDGTLYDKAISRVLGWQTHHPTGVAFKNIQLPNYPAIVEQVKYAAKRIPYFKIVGWDIAIDENAEPIIIEFNVRPEQNQKTFGPTFGELTDEVLREAFTKEHIKFSERGKYGGYIMRKKHRRERARLAKLAEEAELSEQAKQ